MAKHLIQMERDKEAKIAEEKIAKRGGCWNGLLAFICVQKKQDPVLTEDEDEDEEEEEEESKGSNSKKGGDGEEKELLKQGVSKNGQPTEG